MKTAYINASLLDGSESMSVRKNASVIVQDGRIVSTGIEKPGPGMKVVDLGGRYLLPGLINLHVHLPGSGIPGKSSMTPAKVQGLLRNPLTRAVLKKMCRDFARTELLSGVTTIRTVGGLENFDTLIRDKINEGSMMGPRILAANMAVSVPHGHMAGVLAYEAADPGSARAYVQKIAQDKPDLIKLMITGGVLDATVRGEPGVLRMKPEIVKAACDEAHKLGFMVAAHVESPEGVKVALENGVDSIEHGARMSPELVRLFKERKAVDICTISPAVPLATLPPSLTHYSELATYNGQIVMDGIINAARTCLDSGIPVGLGTDTACPFVTHYNMWRELAFFVHYVGVTPAFAIYSATLRNAQLVGLGRETGSIEAGKSADFIAVDKNPLEDLSALASPSMVVIRGRRIDSPRVKKSDIVEKQLDRIMEWKPEEAEARAEAS